MENRIPIVATKDHIQVLKARIEFEVVDKDMTQEQLKQKILEHILETLDEWTKGNAAITIEFETNKNEIHQQDNIFIH